MKQIIKICACVMLCCFLSYKLYAQTVIKTAEATQHINDSVKICDMVYGGNVEQENNEGPIILYMGDSTVATKLSLVFTDILRRKLSFDPEKKLVNQKVCITGRVQNYKGAPAILIANERQVHTEN